MRQKFLRKNKGIATIYASLFFLLLIFSVLTGIFIAFFDYNLAISDQMKITHERLQEKIVLSSVELDPTKSYVYEISVNNTGTIEAKIRGIYLINTTMTSFICDPLASVAPGESVSITSPQIPFEPEANISVTTERGVKATEYMANLYFGPPNQPNYNPSKLYIGPLMLQFDAFWYRKTLDNGILDPNDPWHPGWSIPKGFGYCAWNITVMNVDNRNITLNRFSCFITMPNDSPSSQICWYIEPTDKTNLTQFLAVNQTGYIVYIWSDPKDFSFGSPQKLTYPETTCMVFLTMYGVFHEHDGTTKPYAQTIPFEAAITVVG